MTARRLKQDSKSRQIHTRVPPAREYYSHALTSPICSMPDDCVVPLGCGDSITMSCRVSASVAPVSAYKYEQDGSQHEERIQVEQVTAGHCNG